MRYEVICKYRRKINYNSGMTSHYKYFRLCREYRLIELLDVGKPVCSFVIKDSNNILQIQEVLSNGIINVYSYETHKKITLFAPTPNRIISLYESIGEQAPNSLINKSLDNVSKGFNDLGQLNCQAY